MLHRRFGARSSRTILSFQMLRRAVYEGQYFLGNQHCPAPDRQGNDEIARKERADASPRRHRQRQRSGPFRTHAASLAPDLEVHRALADCPLPGPFPGRAEMIAYCEEKRIPVQASPEKPYSMDRNLLHIPSRPAFSKIPGWTLSRQRTRTCSTKRRPRRRAE